MPKKEGEYTRPLVWVVRGSALGVVTGDICDASWENPSDVAKRHFEKWLEIVRKLVDNSIELLNI